MMPIHPLRDHPGGAAFLSHGFRPFFLLGSIYAGLAIFGALPAPFCAPENGLASSSGPILAHAVLAAQRRARHERRAANARGCREAEQRRGGETGARRGSRGVGIPIERSAEPERVSVTGSRFPDRRR